MKVSIVIPCYNAEKYLSISLDSVLGQTYEDIEVICVDDGSKDRTRDIIKEYMEKDNRVFLVCQENSYAGVARNNGIKKATGDYIMFLDSDDFFKQNTVELLVESAVQNDSDIVICGAYKFDDKTRDVSKFDFIFRKELVPNNQTVFNSNDIPNDIFDVTWDASWNKLFKLDFIKKEKLYFQDTKVSEDVVFNRLGMVLAEKISYVDKYLIYYRVNNNNSLASCIGSDKESALDFFNATLKLKLELEQRGLLEKFWIAFINKCAFDFTNFLNAETQVETYKYIYNFLKETGFEQLGLNEVDEKDIKYSREEFINIRKYDVTDYLFYNFKKMQEVKCAKYKLPLDKIRNKKLSVENMRKNKKIALYAAGEVGKAYYKQLLDLNDYSIAGWFDKNYEALALKGKPVSNPEDILSYEFDVIVIAVENSGIANEISKYLIGLGVDKDKIIY